MSFKPSDFFIGVIDFFSVLLPGTMVTFFLKASLYPLLFNGKVFPTLTSPAEQWIVFLFTTYLVGNIIFGAAAKIDTWIYDNLKLRKLLYKNYDLAYKTATLIRNQYIPVDELLLQLKAAHMIDDESFLKIMGANSKREIINTFKWAQSFLLIKQPKALEEIKRLEADSKFFRSLVLSFLIISAVLFFKQQYVVAVAAIVLAGLSLYRFAHLRYKATDKAYQAIITLNHTSRKKTTFTLPVPAVDNRMQHMASKEVSEKYNALVRQLLPPSANAEIFSVKQNKFWNLSPGQQKEKLYCISGKTVITQTGENDLLSNIIVTPGAIIDQDKNSTYNLTNLQEEDLVILSIK